jgi:hypothetical protein
MKLLLLTSFSVLFAIKSLYSQCSVQVNDSLYSNYNYVLNAINVTGQAPFQFNWTVTDGNGMNVPYTTNLLGDSLTIDAQTIQNSYGCIIYQLCMTDALNCTTCTQGDTSALQVPFNCFSAFSSSIIGSNQVAVTLNNNIPPFLIMQQFLTWTDGQGQGQGMPYMGPGTIVNYTPGPSNTSDQFFLCMMTNLVNGGCISCDSIPYMLAGINEISENDLTLFPNPTDEMLNISSEFAMQSLTISSMNGVLVLKTTLDGKTSHQLDLREIPSGMYITEITTESGIRTKRLIVKN